MPIPPKKLKAFADADSKKGKKPMPEEDEDEKDESSEGEHEDDEKGGGKKGNPFGKSKKGNPGHGSDDDGEEKHLSTEETQALLEKAENEAENGPDGALVEALAGYDGSGEPPPGFDETCWEAAKEIVGPDDYQGTVDPWLVVAHVYKRMGGEVEGGGGGGDEHESDEE